MDIKNLIIDLRRKVELLETTPTIFVWTEPKQPTTQTVWVRPDGTTSYWSWNSWLVSAWVLTDWNISVAFTPTDYRTIAWSAWVISVGTSDSKVDYATTSGSVVMSATTYFYWQEDMPTTIQTTTTAGNAVVWWGILLAVWRLNPDTWNFASLKAFWWPTVDQIIADEIVANSITTNMLQANSITVSKLATSLLYAGSIILDTSGVIRSGQTAYDTGTGFFLGNVAGTTKLSIGNSAWNKMTWDGTTLSITGSITATTGTIGGFNIGVDYIRDVANSFGLASTVTGWDDVRFWAGAAFASRATAPFRVTEAWAVTGSSVTITGGAVSGASIASIPNSTATDISILEKSHNMTFSVTNATTIAWTSGTIVFSNWRTFSISSWNTGVMSALTYIYLDTWVSSTVLQTTTTYSTAMGANKSLLGMAQNNTVTAMFIPYWAGTPLIDGANIWASSIIAGNIAANTITATNISTLNMTGKSCTFDTGTVGGWTLASTTLSATSGGNTTILSSGATAFSAWPTGSPTVTITQAGVLTATGAIINGYDVTSKGSFWGNWSDWVVADSNLTITWSDYTVITKNYSSWTAGTAARSFTVTPIGCILYIKVTWNVDLTNWTFNFNGKGTAGGTWSGITWIMWQTWWTQGSSQGWGWASSINDGMIGSGGGVGWVSLDFVSTNLPLTKQYMIDCWTWWWAGWGWANDWWAGGWCVIMEVSWNVVLGSCTFNFAWDNWVSDPSNGGGWWGGWTLLILYNWTLSWTSTNNVNGGLWWDHTGTSNGGDWTVITQLNTAF